MKFSPDQWAVILGGSSGFGLATAKKLAGCGMSVAVGDVLTQCPSMAPRRGSEARTTSASSVGSVAMP